MKTLVWTRPIIYQNQDQKLISSENLSATYLPCIKYEIFSLDKAIEEFSSHLNESSLVALITSPMCAKIVVDNPILKNLFSNMCFLSIGQKTNSILIAAGLQSMHPKNVLDAKSLGFWICENLSRKKKVILPGPVDRAYNLEDYLSKRFFKTYSIDLYKTISLLHKVDNLHPSLKEKKKYIETLNGVVAFTSPSAVDGFCEYFVPKSNRLYSSLKAVVIGRTTFSRAREHFSECFLAEEASVWGVLQKSKDMLSTI